MSDPVSVAVAASSAAKAASGMFILGLVSAWGLVILAVLAVLGILFEHNGARGWSVFSALLVAVVAYVAFSVSLLHIALGAVAYIVIGVLWSFYRYKRHADKVVETNKDASSREKEIALARLHPKAMLSTLTAWIVIWPFSFVEHFVGDIINAIQTLVTKIFRGIYHRIYDSAVAALR